MNTTTAQTLYIRSCIITTTTGDIEERSTFHRTSTLAEATTWILQRYATLANTPENEKAYVLDDDCLSFWFKEQGGKRRMVEYTFKAATI